MSVPDLTDQTYQMLAWLIGGGVVLFAVTGALYYLGDIMAWFRQAMESLWENSIGQWFDQ